MRVDYFHTGGPGVEIISLDRILSDGPWAGSVTRRIDDSNLGKYLFEVIDPRTNGVIYSRGFASIFGEWETTLEASREHRTFHESLRFPWPREVAQVVLKKRDRSGAFHEIWSVTIDPGSRFVNPAEAPPEGVVWSVFQSGPPTEKVDLVLLGEGYTAAEMDKFHATSTCGRSICRPGNPGSTDLTSGVSAGRPYRPSSTYSIRRDICSRTTTDD
jgi:hypothetical protein